MVTEVSPLKKIFKKRYNIQVKYLRGEVYGRGKSRYQAND